MSADPKFSASRRSFLKLHSQPKPLAIRPPWSDEASVNGQCTSCNACIDVCPESILQADANGQPVVIFDGGECTFCQKCAAACEAHVFDLARTEPWSYKAEIQKGCLQDEGISCQLCRDSCPQTAIRVDVAKRPFGRLRIDPDACNGCGACLVTCPQEVLLLKSAGYETEAA
ncbi:MAG: ferredoxin-type protein NapF [Roseibium sp.]|uniref:ferredoxin-type protein NapF n=1 Tax=Roseibium sp. TaxID=1936156 RepID=UPI00262774FB|nr:ferredoxin-type protein NapF [Roseibium sp.]MCV0428600.1 ferredoxin-type protein NapF [Roseibium sp.]